MAKGSVIARMRFPGCALCRHRSGRRRDSGKFMSPFGPLRQMPRRKLMPASGVLRKSRNIIVTTLVRSSPPVVHHGRGGSST